MVGQAEQVCGPLGELRDLLEQISGGRQRPVLCPAQASHPTPRLHSGAGVQAGVCHPKDTLVASQARQLGHVRSRIFR